MFLEELDEMLAERCRCENSEQRNLVDTRIRTRFGATKCILISDMAGFTRITKEDGIIQFLSLIHRMRKLLTPAVEKHGGKVFKTEADNLFCVFDTAGEGVRCAADLLRATSAYNKGLEPHDRITIAIGIGYGLVLDLDGTDYFGDAMNLASKLGEDIAEDFNILITMDAIQNARKEMDVDTLFDVQDRYAEIVRCVNTALQPGPKMSAGTPVVGIVMGSRSDWPTMESASRVLQELDVPFEVEVVSAHRTPDRLFEYAASAENRGLKVIIAGAGGAAHLPGMLAAKTWIPVLGVPVLSKSFQGLDSLLSIVQMPGGIPVGTLAVGEGGARNAGFLAAAILGLFDDALRDRLKLARERQTADVLAHPDPRVPV